MFISRRVKEYISKEMISAEKRIPEAEKRNDLIALENLRNKLSILKEIEDIFREFERLSK